MAHDVYLEGALFPAVPAVLLPDGNNVLNRFTDVSDTTALAADVAQGKQFYDASGVLTTGTASGGGGGSSWSLIHSSVLTGISTTSTGRATIARIPLGSSAFTSSSILWVHVRDTAGARAGYFYGCDTTYVNSNAYTGAYNVFNTCGYQVLRCENQRIQTYGGSGYGVFGYSITSDGELSIASRYSATYSMTINGDYKVDVYMLTPPSSNWLFG